MPELVPVNDNFTLTLRLDIEARMKAAQEARAAREVKEYEEPTATIIVALGCCGCGCGTRLPAAHETRNGLPRKFVYGHFGSRSVRVIREVSAGVCSIPLTKDYSALVSTEDVEKVLQHKWYAEVAASTVYARRTSDCQFMHVFLMGTTGVDHRDGNGLNNTRTNLRFSTHQQNMYNRIKQRRPKSTSKYKGVHWKTREQRWRTMIKVNGRQIYLGSFTDEAEAALAYDEAARKHYGEFACVNFPRPGERGALMNQI